MNETWQKYSFHWHAFNLHVLIGIIKWNIYGNCFNSIYLRGLKIFEYVDLCIADAFNCGNKSYNSHWYVTINNNHLYSLPLTFC